LDFIELPREIFPSKIHNEQHRIVIKQPIFKNRRSIERTNKMKMIRPFFHFLLLIFICIISSCLEDDVPSQLVNTCGEPVEISPTKYEAGHVDPMRMNSVFIVDDCLLIDYSGGGFSGDTWELELVDSGNPPQTLMPTRKLRLIFRDSEDGEALIEKSAIFDVRDLRLTHSDFVLLQIAVLQSESGSNSEAILSLKYEY